MGFPSVIVEAGRCRCRCRCRRRRRQALAQDGPWATKGAGSLLVGGTNGLHRAFLLVMDVRSHEGSVGVEKLGVSPMLARWGDLRGRMECYSGGARRQRPGRRREWRRFPSSESGSVDCCWVGQTVRFPMRQGGQMAAS